MIENLLHNLLDSLEDQSSEEKVKAAMAAAARTLGFGYFGYAFVSNFPTNRSAIALVNNYPAAWRERRRLLDYVATDPGIRHGLSSKEPIVWSDHWSLADADRISDAGLKYGWTQSSFDGFGAVGILTLSRSGLLITPQELDAKELYMRRLARVAHSAISRIVRASAAPSLEALTPREIEILQWCAAGKTSPEICQILGICASTVSFHMQNSIKKLRVANKTAAVAHALAHGLLNQPFNWDYL